MFYLRNSRPKPVAAAINRLPAVILFIAVAAFIAADLLLGFDFNWVDYAIIIVLALYGFKGYIKGLINTVFSLVGYIAGLVAAYLFSPRLALILQKTAIGQSISNKLDELIPALSQVKNLSLAESRTLLSYADKIPELQQSLSDNLMLKQVLSVTSAAADTGTMYPETVVTVNDLIVYAVLKILAFVVIFLAVKLIVFLIGKLLTKVLGSTALIGTANRLGGMAIGFIEGILICYLVFVFVIPAIGAVNIIKIPENYTQSVVLTWFNKLVALIIGK